MNEFSLKAKLFFGPQSVAPPRARLRSVFLGVLHDDLDHDHDDDDHDDCEDPEDDADGEDCDGSAK